MKARPTQDQVNFWRVQNLNDLELMHATFIGQSFSRHVHENFAIGVVETGTGAFTYRGTTQVAPTGSIFVINPGAAHTGGGFKDLCCTYRVMYPDALLLQRISSAIADKRRDIPFFSSAIIQDVQLRGLLHYLHSSLEDESTTIEQESQLLWTFSQLISRYADGVRTVKDAGHEHQAVKRVREYLEAHYDENVSLTQLSDLTGLSAFYLTRVFCRETGLPPHTYLIQLRISRAKSLISQGYPIVRVALETGFTHQSHLNKHFKRFVGMTPGQYQAGSNIVQDGKSRSY